MIMIIEQHVYHKYVCHTWPISYMTSERIVVCDYRFFKT